MATSSSSGSISSLGVGSGLDLSGLLTKLMAVEQQPLTLLDTQEASYQAKLSTYGTLKGSLSSLQSAAKALSSTSSFNAYKTTLSSSTYFSASASSSAAAGSYSVEVQNLAKAQTLTTGVVSDPTAVIGTGSLTFQFGTTSGSTFNANSSKAAQTVTIDSSHNTLNGIRDAVNAANIGVSASLVNDGTGYRLMFTSTDSGTANTLKITSSAAALNSFTYDPAAGSNPLSQIQAASDAKIIVNGLTITKSSNVITDAISGVTLNLLQAETTAGTTSNLSVTRDTDSITTALQTFVKTYNDTAKAFASATAYDATNKTASTLTGDATARSIVAQMRSLLGSTLQHAGGGLKNLSDAGISFQSDGTLKLDTTKLNKVLNDSSKDLASLFASEGVPSDSQVTYVSSTNSTKPGSYGLNISQIATRSTLTGSGSTGSLTISSGVNDTVTLALNGTTATVTLSPGTYTAASLANEVQTKINGASALKSASATVTVGAGTTGSVTSSIDLATLSYPVSPASGSNSFNVTLGGTTQTVTLGAGPYTTAAEMKAAVQASLDAQFGSGVVTASLSGNKLSLAASAKFGAASTISVAANGADTLYADLFGSPTTVAGSEMTLTSDKYGSGSTITISSSSGATNLFGTSLTGTTGLDVAGSIGSLAATGNGQKLTGSGDASGLTVTVAGTATGSRGQISFDSGFATRLSSLIDSFIGTKGIIAARTDGINSSIKALDKQRQVINDRLTVIEANYKKRFAALDSLISSMQTTQSYLTTQLAKLSSTSSSSSN